MQHALLQYGLILLFAVVMLESAGVPLPGETALVTAGVLADRGHYDIVLVIALEIMITSPLGSSRMAGTTSLHR